MSLTVHLALVFHVFIAVAVMVMVCGRHGLWLSWYRLVMGKSIQIDSHCRIIMKNFDSVPQLQHFSYVHHCAARSRHGSNSRQCRHLLLQRQLAALLQCGPAGHSFHGLVGWSSSFRARVQNPWCGLLRVVLTEQWIESNWIESTRLWHWIESFSILPNRPSLNYTQSLIGYEIQKF